MPRSKQTNLQTSVQTSVQPSVQPSIVQTVKEGFAFGIGSSLARNAIESILNSYQEDTSDLKRCIQSKKSDKCNYLNLQTRQAWTQCMKESKFDDESCNSLFNN